MELHLAGRRALVTGATSGIGHAIAAGLIAEGAQVFATGRAIDSVPEGCAGTISIDLRDAGAAATIIDAAVAQLGGIDIVVAAAGRSYGGNLDQVDDARWSEGLDLNLSAIVRLCRAAGPHLRQSSAGRLILLGAVSGLEPRADHVVSNVAKAGIHALTKSLSRDLASDDVLVNCIAPGRIRSGQIDRAYPTQEQRAAAAAGLVPLGRFGDVESVVPLALLLASPVNSYTTGQIIAVDGGMSHAV